MKKEGSMKAESSASIATHQSKCGDGQKREERCLVLKCIYFSFLLAFQTEKKHSLSFVSKKKEQNEKVQDVTTAHKHVTSAVP